MIRVRRFSRYRDRLIEDAMDDYVGFDGITDWAGKMTGRRPVDGEPELRDAVTELLVSLLAHDRVAVVNGAMNCEHTDPAVLREVVETAWAANGGRPSTGQVAWVVRRPPFEARRLAPGERPTPDAISRPIESLDELRKSIDAARLRREKRPPPSGFTPTSGDSA